MRTADCRSLVVWAETVILNTSLPAAGLLREKEVSAARDVAGTDKEDGTTCV
jgi:hypothetical protein